MTDLLALAAQNPEADKEVQKRITQSRALQTSVPQTAAMQRSRAASAALETDAGSASALSDPSIAAAAVSDIPAAAADAIMAAPNVVRGNSRRTQMRKAAAAKAAKSSDVTTALEEAARAQLMLPWDTPLLDTTEKIYYYMQMDRLDAVALLLATHFPDNLRTPLLFRPAMRKITSVLYWMLRENMQSALASAASGMWAHQVDTDTLSDESLALNAALLLRMLGSQLARAHTLLQWYQTNAPNIGAPAYVINHKLATFKPIDVHTHIRQRAIELREAAEPPAASDNYQIVASLARNVHAIAVREDARRKKAVSAEARLASGKRYTSRPAAQTAGAGSGRRAPARPSTQTAERPAKRRKPISSSSSTSRSSATSSSSSKSIFTSRS